MIVVQPIFADVDDVQTDGQSINQTEPTDGKDGESVGGGGEDVPWWEKAWNEIKEIGSDGLELIDEFGDTIGEQWNEFLDWAGDASEDAWEWMKDVGSDIGDWMSDAGEAIGDFFSDAWDWVQENEWFQTIVAGVIATVAIVGGIFLVVGSLPGLLVIGVIGAFALGAGFLYQWIAGDNYNFFGAFFSSLVGGVIGYVGMTTGAFAAGWAWLRHTAAPATWAWIRNTAVPWVVGKGRAAWGWARTVAYPWVRGKVVSGWRWFKGLPAWGQIASAYSLPNLASTLFGGAAVSGAASAIVNVIGQLLGDDPFDIKSLVVDTTLGALTGAAFAPIAALAASGVAISGSLIATMSLIGGVENWAGGVWEEGDWTNWQSFVSGGVTSLISLGALSKIFGLIPNPFAGEYLTKQTEEPIKDWIEKILGGGESGNTETPGNKNPEPTPETPQEPTNGPSETPTQEPADTQVNEPVDEGQKPIQQPQTNPNTNHTRVGGGINPHPVQQ